MGITYTWDGLSNIASASLSVGGNPVNMGDLRSLRRCDGGLG